MKNFKIGVQWTLGFSFTIIVIGVVLFGLCSFFGQGFINKCILAFTLDSYELSCDTSLITEGTIYSATLNYYNQIIGILISLAAIAGAMAFIHIRILSNEKADTAVASGVNRYFQLQEFNDKLTQSLVDTFEGEYGIYMEGFEELKNKIEALEQKYDRHDEMLSSIHERDLDEEVTIDGHNQED